MKRYYELDALGDMPDSHALLDRITTEGASTWDLYNGEHLGKKITSAVTRFDPEFKGKKLGAVMGNTSSILVLRHDLAMLIHDSSPEETELIPIEVRDHKNKPVSEAYFILNICAVEDVLNPRASSSFTRARSRGLSAGTSHANAPSAL